MISWRLNITIVNSILILHQPTYRSDQARNTRTKRLQPSMFHTCNLQTHLSTIHYYIWLYNIQQEVKYINSAHNKWQIMWKVEKYKKPKAKLTEHACSHIFNKDWQMLNCSTLCPTSTSYSFIEMMSWLSESNTVACYYNGIIWKITLCQIIQHSKN